MSTWFERTDLSTTARRPGEFDLLLKSPRQQRYRVEASADLTRWPTAISLRIKNLDGTGSYKHLLAENEAGMLFRARPE